jgi:enamine deaminase RidA (YjgF/YER057c/UK114 family)
MARREMIEVPGLGHSNPIPLAVKIGSMVFSGGISGQDPATGKVPSEPEAQIALAFQNMQKIVEAAGGTTGDIAKVVVYLRDMQLRAQVNSEWVKMFPDAEDRPVRHTMPSDSPTNPGIQLEMTAVL